MKDAKEMALAMSDFVNNMTCPMDEFISQMNREHRTLQQTFTDLCFSWIRNCAERHQRGDFDLRNEYSCKKSAEIVEKIDLYKCPFI